jgi:hypothetical protein
MCLLILGTNSLDIYLSHTQYKMNTLLAAKGWELNVDQLSKLVHQALWIACTSYNLLNLAHWIFAMKYWGIAIRTEQTFSRSFKPFKYLVQVVSYAGIGLVILTFTVQGLLINRDTLNTNALTDFADVLVLLVQFLALGFLIDAFRRFLKIDGISHLVSKKAILIHMLAFGLFFISTMLFVVMMTVLLQNIMSEDARFVE